MPATVDDNNLLKVPGQQGKPNGNRSLNNLGSPRAQPEGGWGWMVCFTSMACNGTVFSIINTFGILYVAMREHFSKGQGDDVDDNISFKTAWVGSVCTGITFFMCMISSIVSDRMGIRLTGFLGGLVAFVGMLSSAFVDELMLLYLTYGLLLGIGFAFSYAPSLVILGHYFKRRLGLVNGLVTFGSSLFTMGLSLGLPPLLDAIGLKYTLLVLSGLVALIMPYSLSWTPVFTRDNLGASQAAMSTLSMEMIQSKCTDCYRFTRRYLNVRIWRNKGYVVWALSTGLSLFGYFVPFVHLVKHVKDVFPESDGSLLVLCLSITSGVSRIVMGKVADFPWANRIRMQQSAFLILGVCTLCIPFSQSFGGLIAISLIMGLCDGVFICLLGPIAFDIVGERGASQALGFLFGIFSIPMTVGPPVAGLLYDHLHSYDVAFHVAGCPPILGALLMFFIPKTKPQVPAVTSTQEFAAVSCHDIYRSKIDIEIAAPPPSSQIAAATELITINDMSELALLTSDDVPENEENGDVKNRGHGPKQEEEDITADAVENEDRKENDIKSNYTDKDLEPIVPQITITDLDEDVDV